MLHPRAKHQKNLSTSRCLLEKGNASNDINENRTMYFKKGASNAMVRSKAGKSDQRSPETDKTQ